MKMFTSLEDLNKFLTEELGIAPMTQEMVDQGIAVAVAQAGPDAEEATASFTFNLGEGDDTEGGEVIPVEDFNDYVEFTSGQIARLTTERDDARKLVDLERQAHHECHEHMGEHIHQIRVQGYAEALAAGLFPGVPFERLDANHQEVLMRQAHAGIEKVDAVRAELNTPTKH